MCKLYEESSDFFPSLTPSGPHGFFLSVWVCSERRQGGGAWLLRSWLHPLPLRSAGPRGDECAGPRGDPSYLQRKTAAAVPELTGTWRYFILHVKAVFPSWT